jgi:hypothetical protein
LVAYQNDEKNAIIYFPEINGKGYHCFKILSHSPNSIEDDDSAMEMSTAELIICVLFLVLFFLFVAFAYYRLHVKNKYLFFYFYKYEYIVGFSGMF